MSTYKTHINSLKFRVEEALDDVHMPRSFSLVTIFPSSKQPYLIPTPVATSTLTTTRENCKLHRTNDRTTLQANVLCL
jgi:hypothetical protein